MRWIALMLCATAFAQEDRYYTIETLPTPEDVSFEVSGLAFLPDGRLAATIRKGEVWLIASATGAPGEQSFKRIGSALHEPLGLLYHDGDLYTAQRSELTRMIDHDGDEVIDEYETISNAWGLTGNYHEYAFGPVLDRDGNFLLTLNQTIGKPVFNDTRWRGWGVKIGPDGSFTPLAPGMRSPCGLGANLEGDVFFTDQQGNWVPAGSLHHLRAGVFYGHPESLPSCALPGSPLQHGPDVPEGRLYPEAVAADPALVPPAVWFPYKKMGMSTTDIIADSADGAFGPFAGNLFVGEFTMAQVNRVFLEKVDGEYQGACFPFRSGFQCAVLRFAWGPDKALYIGESNRGWNSVGSTPYGLQRLKWTGETPFDIAAVRAMPDGFALDFTKPVDEATVTATGVTITSYTYKYHRAYGSDELDVQTHSLRVAGVDGSRVRVEVDGLRAGYVHEITAAGVRDAGGEPLLHPTAYYTLNRLPVP